MGFRLVSIRVLVHINYEFSGARANYYALIAAVKGRFGKHGFLTASYTHSCIKG
jgi:hypothetical protein